MRLILTTAAALALVAWAPGLSSDAYAHGGSYRGPAGEVPPDSREPSDPPPPPAGGGPTTPGGETGGPTTGGEDVGGPTTGGDDGGGPTTGGSGGGPAPSGGGPSGPTTGGGTGRPSSAAKGPGYEDWTFWWNFNKDDILQLKSAVKGTQAVTRSGTGLHAFGKKKSGDARVVSATDAAIQDQIIPALRLMLDQDDLNFDIQSAAALALAKIGDQKVIPTLKKMARNDKGDYHRVVEESAALAFGLLQVDNDEVRDFLIDIVSDKKRNASFVRPFAAISLGLLGNENDPDDKVSQALFNILSGKENKPDVKPAALVALGLLGDDANVPKLLAILDKGSTDAKGADALNDVELAFVVQALGKSGRPGIEGEDAAVIDLLSHYLTKGKKKANANLRRSAAIALGQIAPQCEGKVQQRIVNVLKDVAKDGDDASERNFAMVAIGRIASTDGIDEDTRGVAIKTLSYYLNKGKPANLAQPFAALSLGLVGRAMVNASMPVPEEDIRKPLRKKFEDGGEPRARGAYAIASGLVRDPLAVPALVSMLKDRGGDKRLRGYSAVSLGMIRSPEARDAIRSALTDDTDRDLRVQTAVAAGLMGDASVITDLVAILESGEESQYILGSVALALGQIGDERVIEPLLRISQDEAKKFPDITRALATVALGQIGDRRDVPVLSRVARDINFRAIGQVPSLTELLTIL